MPLKHFCDYWCTLAHGCTLNGRAVESSPNIWNDASDFPLDHPIWGYIDFSMCNNNDKINSPHDRGEGAHGSPSELVAHTAPPSSHPSQSSQMKRQQEPSQKELPPSKRSSTTKPLPLDIAWPKSRAKRLGLSGTGSSEAERALKTLQSSTHQLPEGHSRQEYAKSMPAPPNTSGAFAGSSMAAPLALPDPSITSLSGTAAISSTYRKTCQPYAPAAQPQLSQGHVDLTNANPGPANPPVGYRAAPSTRILGWPLHAPTFE